jgi:hypothetical protein
MPALLRASLSATKGLFLLNPALTRQRGCHCFKKSCKVSPDKRSISDKHR